MEINKTNNLSFYNDQGILTIPAKQYDTGRKFSFNITADDEVIDLTKCSVCLRMLKSDGTQFQGSDCCSISGNTITVDTSISNGPQILACAGINKCELHLNDENGKGITTWTFNIEVMPRVHDGSNVTSTDSWDSWDNIDKKFHIIELSLNDKADMVSPALMGVPTAPTASLETDSDQIATTAFVQTALTNGIENAMYIEEVQGGDAYISSSQSGKTASITHKNISRSNTTSIASPLNGSSFTAVKSITSDAKGHVTGVNTETVNLPNITNDSLGAYPRTGGDINGDVTIYAKNTNKAEIQDVKIRKGRIDIFKELTGAKDSSVIIEMDKRISVRDFAKSEFVGDKLTVGFRTMDADGTTHVKNWLDFNNSTIASAIDIKNLDSMGIRLKDLSAYFSKITLANQSGVQNDPIDIFGKAPLVFNTDDAAGNHAVMMFERDKLQIGTTDTSEHTLKDLMNQENSSSHPSIGFRMEQNCGKFTFYSEPSGIEFELQDLVNNRWYNTSNGTYKFVVMGNKFVSNNKGIQSSTAESTWQGIFSQNKYFTIKYKVSGETNFDKLTITLDGTNIVNGISGDGTEQTYSCNLKAGKHTLKATYRKDGSNDKFEDRAYLEFDNAVVMLNEIQYDTVPTKDSPLPITSGAVYDAIENIRASLT